MKTLLLFFLSIASCLAQTISITNTPIISTTIYTNGNSLGGVFTLYSNPGLLKQSIVKLQSISIKDLSNQKAATTLLIFNVDPLATGWNITNHTDVVAPTNYVAIPIKYSVATTDWTTIGGQAFVTLSFLNCPIEMDVTNNTLYAVWINGGTPTYAVTNAMQFKYVLE